MICSSIFNSELNLYWWLVLLSAQVICLSLRLLWSARGLAGHLRPCHDLVCRQRPLTLLTYRPPAVCEHRLCCWCRMRSTWMRSEGQALLFVCCETKPARSREQHIQLSRRNFINFILRCAARETRHAEPGQGNFGHGLGLCGSQASTSRFPPLCRLQCEFYF